MTIKELKQRIENLPDSMEVFMNQRSTDFKYGLVNGATVKEIPFMEDPDGEEQARDTVLILSED